jgi:phosphoribosylglycinamide formyltransferase-1
MKFALLCSAGGSAFFSAYDILVAEKKCSADQFILITDRNCDAEERAAKRGINSKRVPYHSAQQFSIDVTEYIVKFSADTVLMLYSRLITEDLFLRIPTLNVHPSLLPSFPGINAIGKALSEGVKFVGCTLHLTTEKIDAGFILGQVISPIRVGESRVCADRISYLQKTYLVLLAIDALTSKLIKLSPAQVEIDWPYDAELSCSANPSIPSVELRNRFFELQRSLDMVGLII